MTGPRKPPPPALVWAPYVLFVGIIAVTPLVGVAVASWWTGHGWLWPGRDMFPRTAAQLWQHPTGPWLAYPRQQPGPAQVWTATGLLLLVVLAVTWWALMLRAGWTLRAGDRRERRVAAERASSSAWAKPTDTVALAQSGPLRWQVGLHGRLPLYTGYLESLLVTAPTGAGKTSRVVVGNFIRAADSGTPRVLTTVKTDAVALTWAAATAAGPVWVFAPGARGYPLCRWNPLDGITDWGGALSVAGWLSRSQRVDARESDHMNYWNTLGVKMLAPLLYLAAATDRTLADVQGWVETTDTDGVREQLRALPATLPGRDDAVRAWQATCAREARALSSVFGTAEVILDGFNHPDVRDLMTGHWSEPDVYTPAKLLRERGTLYIFAATREKVQQYGAVFDAMMAQLVAHVAAESSTTGKPIPTGLALILEEAANIARIRDLDYIASAGRGMGIHLMSIWQDRHQMEALYGPAVAKSITANHLWTLWLPGTRDPDTVRELSDRVSTYLAEDTSTSTSQDGSTGTSTRHVDQAALGYRDVAAMGRDDAILLGAAKPIRCTTVPYYEDTHLVAQVGVAVVREFTAALGGRR